MHVSLITFRSFAFHDQPFSYSAIIWHAKSTIIAIMSMHDCGGTIPLLCSIVDFLDNGGIISGKRENKN